MARSPFESNAYARLMMLTSVRRAAHAEGKENPLTETQKRAAKKLAIVVQNIAARAAKGK